MITPEEFVQAQQTVRCIIQVVFHPEYQKRSHKHFLSRNGWEEGDYDIERMHMSGHHFRLTPRNDDLREKDVYIDAEDVYSWYQELGMEVLRGEK